MPNELEILNAILSDTGTTKGIMAGVAYLALGKTPREAIGKLVGDILGVPGAAAQWLSQRITDDGNARTTIQTAIVEAAANVAAGDSAVLDRAIVSWGGKAVKSQINKEKIAEKTINLLAEAPPTPGQIEGPSDDFMNLFSSLSENASSENLQHLFASVLAGEIRKPKSFSLRTIQFVAVMDNELAQAVNQFKRWVTLDFIVNIEDFNSDPTLSLLGLLQDVAIVRTPPGLGLQKNVSVPPEGGSLILPFDKKCIVAEGSPGQSIGISSIFLTPMGQEVMSLLPSEDDDDFISKAARHLAKKTAGIINVQIGDVITVDDAISAQNLKPID